MEGISFPAPNLQVQEINNRTDILTNYKLELIVADDGCNISWKSIISLINNLYYEALINVHLGSAPELGNRVLYPYSFGINPPTSIQIDAVVALFMRNNWTRAAVLYNPDMLVDYNSFRLFQNKISGKADLSFVSPANPDYLPLVALKSTFVRVIVAFLRGETLGRALCVAYRMGHDLSELSSGYFLGATQHSQSLLYTIQPCTLVTRLMQDKALNQTLRFQNNAYQQYNATRNHKAIKASSSRLNHFAYIGCYLILLATLLYTITETFPLLDFVQPGLSMIPTDESVMKNILPSGDRFSVTIEEFCFCKYQVQWIASIIAFETIFIVLLVYFAISTRTIKKKEFQTRSIIVLVYLLILTTVIGGVIYLIAVIVEAGVNTSYGILASLLTVTVYLCIVLFFTPPILPVIDDLRHPHQSKDENPIDYPHSY
eukprot:Em0004g1324a